MRHDARADDAPIYYHHYAFTPLTPHLLPLSPALRATPRATIIIITMMRHYYAITPLLIHFRIIIFNYLLFIILLFIIIII